MIEISVIIPTFNRKDCLRKALQSVLSQAEVSFEIIVIDDGSTDNTRLMIERDFPQVTYIHQANQGPAAARNRGIERARGQWIAFLDSDDEWFPGKLKAQMDFFALNPDCLIAQTEEIWIRNGKRVNPMKKHKKSGGWIFEKCLPLCIISPSAVMMNRNLFEEVGLFDESLPACEDYDLWLRIAAKFPVGLIEKPYVVKYGGHADQRSHEFPAMDQFRIQSLIKIISAGGLKPEQEKAAREMLEFKAKIYRKGALKRGKKEEVEKLTVMLSEASHDETLQAQ
ncbi:MAG: glycosyltransferase [Candidatus Omnitrophica bacterium]|nr:glycosyltransferase [Candidatus Omnitrophota bacterium]